MSRFCLKLFAACVILTLMGCQSAAPDPRTGLWKQAPQTFQRDAAQAIEHARAVEPSARPAERLAAMADVGAELGQRERSALCYLQASILYGLYLETRPLTALPYLGRVEELAQQALAIDPVIDHAGPHRTLGWLYALAPAGISVGDLDQAEIHFYRAVELAPEFPGNWLGLGDVLYEFEDDDAAREAYLAALAAPNDQSSAALDDREAARQRLAERFPDWTLLSAAGD